MAQYNKMTESKFKAVKILLNGGATYKEASEYMQVAESTVYRIKCAESWEDFLNGNAARVLAAKEAKKKANKETAAKVAAKVGAVPASQLPQPEAKQETVKVVHEQSVTIQATHYMIEELRRTNELLTLISNKLAFVVDQLT